MKQRFSHGLFRSALIIVLLQSPGVARIPITETISDTIDAISRDDMRERETAISGVLKPQWCLTTAQVWYWDSKESLTVVDPEGPTATRILTMAQIKATVAKAAGRDVSAVKISRDAFIKPSGTDRLIFKYNARAFAIEISTATIAQLNAATYDALSKVVPRVIHPTFPYTFRGEAIEVPSSDGKWFATLVKDNLAIRRSDDDKALVELTSDGQERFSYDNASQYVEKFDVAWSPVANKLAAAKLDTRNIYYLPILNLVDRRPTVQYVQMPLHDDPTEQKQFTIFDVTTHTRVDIALDKMKEHYSSIQGWGADGKKVFIDKLSRDWKDLEIIEVDASSGHARTVLRDHENTFIDSWMILGPQPFYSLTTGLILMSERSGYRQIYYYNNDGTLLRQLTNGDLPVTQIVSVDERDNWVYYQAPQTHARPYDNKLFRVSLRGGKPQLLTAALGEHQVSMAPSGRYFIDTFSSSDTPYTTELRAADGRLIASLAHGDVGALKAMGWVAPEAFTASTTDGKRESHGEIFYPNGFDASKKYPVVEIIYGDMYTKLTPNELSWRGYGTFQRILARAGYIVVTVDAPGTPGLGKIYNDVPYGTFPQGIVPNHVHAIREIAKRRPYMDLNRVGIFGISTGGMMVERALIDEPTFYKVAIAVNPGGDVYAFPCTWYEIDLGLPRVNPKGYENAEILPHVARIAAKLLVFGSALDADAGFPPSAQIVDAMIRARKDIDFMILPRANHSIRAAGNDSGNRVSDDMRWWFYAYCLRYFQQYLAGGN